MMSSNGNRAMTNKNAVGVKKKNLKYERKLYTNKQKKDDTPRVPVYIPELHCTVMLKVGTDVRAVIEKYIAAKALNSRGFKH